MNIPSSKGLFSPEATNFPTEGFKITPGLIENIGAMVDPAGTLLDYQRKQAAKTMAGVNFNGLLPLMKKKAMQETEKYLGDYQKLMDKRKGISRTKLNTDDEIEMERRRNELTEGIDSLKQNAKDYEWAINFGLQNGMTPEQFKEFNLKYEEPFLNDEKGLGDVHNPKALMIDFLLKNGKVSTEKSMYKSFEDLAKNANYSQTGGMEKDYDVKKTEKFVTSLMDSPEWKENTENMLTRRGIIKPEMNPAEKYNATVTAIKEQFNPKEFRPPSISVVTINQPTPNPEGGNDYSPFPEYQKVKSYKIGNSVKKGQLISYNDESGQVVFIPEKEEVTGVGRNKKVKTFLDYNNPESYNIDEVDGARNAFSKQTNKGGQKIKFPQKKIKKTATDYNL